MSPLGRVLLPLALLFIVGTGFLYAVDETEQVIITQFGEYKRTERTPGLQTKWPFVEVVWRFDKRILSSDATPAKYLTLDKKRVVIDHLTRWRISDPLVFFKSVQNEAGARARIDDIVFSDLRRELASHPFAKIISVEREPIMATVTQRSAEKTKQFGVEIVDVRIKRADLPEEVQASVFARMQAEREREAKRYRSEGEEEAAKIRAQTDKERTIIIAKAYEASETLRGEGDAEATRVYAKAYRPEADFYSFLRRLEAYEKIMKSQNMVVLSTDSDLFRFLSNTSARDGSD
jgi:membrane protease subunit HflC